MTFTLAVGSGITIAQDASFVLGSILKWPFTRERPAREERGIIPLAIDHRIHAIPVHAEGQPH